MESRRASLDNIFIAVTGCASKYKKIFCSNYRFSMFGLQHDSLLEPRHLSYLFGFLEENSTCDLSITLSLSDKKNIWLWH
jgi:hypothetical protein